MFGDMFEEQGQEGGKASPMFLSWMFNAFFSIPASIRDTQLIDEIQALELVQQAKGARLGPSFPAHETKQGSRGWTILGPRAT